MPSEWNQSCPDAFSLGENCGKGRGSLLQWRRPGSAWLAIGGGGGEGGASGPVARFGGGQGTRSNKTLLCWWAEGQPSFWALSLSPSLVFTSPIHPPTPPHPYGEEKRLLGVLPTPSPPNGFSNQSFRSPLIPELQRKTRGKAPAQGESRGNGWHAKRLKGAGGDAKDTRECCSGARQVLQMGTWNLLPAPNALYLW